MKNIPAWMTLGDGTATVTLSTKTELNGVKVGRITLREPTIGDVRGARKTAKDDNEQQEINVFASISGCSPADIERLTLRDYGRVQEGYFRLVADEGSDSTDGADAGATPGN